MQSSKRLRRPFVSRGAAWGFFACAIAAFGFMVYLRYFSADPIAYAMGFPLVLLYSSPGWIGPIVYVATAWPRPPWWEQCLLPLPAIAAVCLFVSVYP